MSTRWVLPGLTVRVTSLLKGCLLAFSLVFDSVSTFILYFLLFVLCSLVFSSFKGRFYHYAAWVCVCAFLYVCACVPGWLERSSHPLDLESQLLGSCLPWALSHERTELRFSGTAECTHVIPELGRQETRGPGSHLVLHENLSLKAKWTNKNLIISDRFKSKTATFLGPPCGLPFLYYKVSCEGLKIRSPLHVS